MVEPTPEAPKRGRFVVGSIIGLGLAGGVAATLLVMMNRGDATERTTAAPAATVTPPSAPLSMPPIQETPTPAPTPTSEEISPVPTGQASTTPRQDRRRDRPRAKPITKVDPPPAPPVEQGSGSQAVPVTPRSKPKWDPTLLLPTDSGSGMPR